MVRRHGMHECRRDPGGRLQYLGRMGDVRTHQHDFFRSEPLPLVQHLVRNIELADVDQEAHQPGYLQILLRHLEKAGKGNHVHRNLQCLVDEVGPVS